MRRFVEDRKRSGPVKIKRPKKAKSKYVEVEWRGPRASDSRGSKAPRQVLKAISWEPLANVSDPEKEWIYAQSPDGKIKVMAPRWMREALYQLFSKGQRMETPKSSKSRVHYHTSHHPRDKRSRDQSRNRRSGSESTCLIS
jgi:hypothetical protein